jgi:hypothetical protein
MEYRRWPTIACRWQLWGLCQSLRVSVAPHNPGFGSCGFRGWNTIHSSLMKQSRKDDRS